MITIAKTSGSFWQYHKDDPNDTKSKFLLIQIQDKSNRKNAGNTKDVQIAMPFKYLSNFWKALLELLIQLLVHFTRRYQGYRMFDPSLLQEPASTNQFARHCLHTFNCLFS